MSFLGLIVPGLVVGLAARMLVPTGRHYGCLGTILLGIAGSFVGGTIGSLLGGDGFEIQSAGWIGSIIGAALVLFFIGRRSQGGHA